MKKSLITAAFLSIFFLGTIAGNAFAQRGDFKIRNIAYEFKMRSGTRSISSGLAGLGNLGGYAQKWGVIHVFYSSRPEWSDDVQLKYYVMLQDQKEKPMMLSDAVTYVSVRKGFNHQAHVFLHPNSLARYGEVKRILVEIWYQGVLMDSKQWPRKVASRWWDKIAPISGALRTRYFTPFEHDYEVNEEDVKIVLP